MTTKRKDGALAALFHQLSMMLKAGVQPEEATALLSEGDDENVRLLSLLQLRLSQGDSLSAAAEKTGEFPAYAVRLMAVGETAGRLEECLEALGDYYDRQVRLRARIRSALTYPTLLLLLLCAVLAVLVFAVLPVFSSVYENLSGSIESSAYGYVTAAGILSRVCLIVTAVFCAVVLGALALFRTGRGKAALLPVLERLPGIGAALRQLAVSRLSYALSTLLKSGMDPDSALETAKGLNEHRALGRQLVLCQYDLSNGLGLASSLSQRNIYGKVEGRLLRAASGSGNLSEMLSSLSDDSEAAGQDGLYRLIDLTEPVLTTFLTVAVGFSLLSVMLPLLGILGAIS